VSTALRAEWIKFRTVRGWLIGLLLVPVLTVLLGWFTGSSNFCSVGPGPGMPVAVACSSPIGPGGEAVRDQFYFVHQALAGNGTITAQLTGITGADVQPWAKAGIIVKASLTQGSAYAAMLGTGAHGVRFQYDYTGDVGGLSGLSPHWLRLTRSGDVITGFDSADGTHWFSVGSASLPGLPATVQVGMLATSPGPVVNGAAHVVPTVLTGTFTDVTVTGAAAGSWTGTGVGGIGLPRPQGNGRYVRSGDTFQVTSNLTGDIAPAEPGAAGAITPIAQTLVGAFAGLIAAIVVSTLFITTEYRRGLIRVTLAATPVRSRVLAAKALVTGAVTFVVALAGVAITIPVAERFLRRNGNFIAPVSTATELRVVLGTAAVFALASMLALAIGTIVRHGATAVMTVIVVIVLPYLLAVSTPLLPVAASDWLLRLTPAAGFAIQQTFFPYPQVADTYTPFNGFFPLAPWAGLAVLCAWTLAALGLAGYLLNKRDA
jgi:ABC-type transport system involved in multi-copper enzyme maturation permease subunit/regulation of enolase protein 1 (concanavalin A-like superfamily)